MLQKVFNKMMNKKGCIGQAAKIQAESGTCRYAVLGKKWIFFGKEGVGAGLNGNVTDGSKVETATLEFAQE